MLCFRKFTVAKNLWLGRGGDSRISLEKFLSHSVEIFPRRESFGASLNSSIGNVF